MLKLRAFIGAIRSVSRMPGSRKSLAVFQRHFCCGSIPMCEFNGKPQIATWLELRDDAGAYLDGCLRSRIDDRSRGTPLDLKAAEARQRNAFSLTERLRNGLQDGLNRSLGSELGEIASVSDFGGEGGAVHRRHR